MISENKSAQCKCINCNEHCQEEPCICKVPIFSSLNHNDLMRIGGLIKHKEYKKGEVVIHEGEKTGMVTIIREGKAKACKYSADGKEQILYIFSEGDFFGEQNLFNEKAAAYSIIALTDLSTCTLSKSEFQTLLYNYPEISIKILTDLSERMYRLENAMQQMGMRNVDYKISSLLMDFADKFGSKVKDGILIKMPLSREGVANYLGIARETVSRKLGQLEKEGIIRQINNKSIIIIKSDKLTEVLEGQI